MKKRNKIAFGSATPVFADDERTITEYIFHIRFDNKKRRMSFRYHVATKSIISHTPFERKLTAEQCEIITHYFNCFVGKRKAKDSVHAKPQILKMNIAIAEACGLDVIQNPHGYKDRPEAWKTGFFTPKAAKQRRISWPSSATVKVIPDYCNDLNAMREAEETLAESLQEKYLDNLYSVCNPDSMYKDTWKMNRATARQRAEAFLETLGKWEGAK